MSGKTQIEWTDRTWNPVVGCTKVSQGCKFCYAKTIHDMRHKAFLSGKALAPQYSMPFEMVQLKPERLKWPLSLREPSRIFVNSVSDLFHEDVPDAFILEVFSVMARAQRHTFQVLTKRPARMLRWFTHYLDEACSGERPAERWPLPNVWLGVSVENQYAADERIPLLIATPAAIRWLSCEPLLGPIDFTPPEYRGTNVNENDWLQAINWVVVGGESSGNRKQATEVRPMDPSWARGIRDACRNRTDMGRPWPLPFLFKQWGEYAATGVNSSHVSRLGKKKAGRLLDGRTWDEYPEARP